MTLNMKLGDLLDKLMVERKITQAQLARKANIHFGTVNKMVKNKGNISIHMWQRAFDALEVEVVVTAHPWDDQSHTQKPLTR